MFNMRGAIRHVRVQPAAALRAVTLASVLLGIAAFHSRSVPPSRGAVLLAMCTLWVPPWLLGEWVGDQISPSRELSLGFVPAGLAWVLLGYTLGFIRGEQATVEPATPARTTPGPS